MSRWKRFTIGASMALIALCGVTSIWYQRHYVLPPEPARTEALPTPNGFDTLREATTLCVERVGDTKLTLSSWPPVPLQKRRALLVANEAAIAQTRQGLTQDYFPPALPWPQNHLVTYHALYRQTELLIFASHIYADSGDFEEAMNCALDAIELGVKLPRGGALSGFYNGTSCEQLGKSMAWGLADRVGAKAARAAAERLQRIEAERWPLADALREERRVNSQSIRATFAGGPFPSWAAIDSLIDFRSRSAQPQKPVQRTKWERLWLQARIVYYGPRAVLDSTDSWLQQLQERTSLPWDYKRYQTQNHLLPASAGNPFSQLAGYSLANGRIVLTDIRNRLPLLQTYLSLRAKLLETGRAPLAPVLPPDPFSPTGAPLRYRCEGKKIYLWSIGPDGRDDNGSSQDPRSSDGWGDILAGYFAW